MKETIEYVKIILLCVAASVVYGVIHDMFTAHFCVEYFTIGHPKVINSQSPILLAFTWGFLATSWVGLFLGIPLAIVSRGGKYPKRDARSLIRPIVILLLVMAVSAVLSGIAGYYLATYGGSILYEPLASKVPKDRHIPFIVDLWMHGASYIVGILGGMILINVILFSRKRAS